MVTSEDNNISFAGFVEEEYLPLRLAAADLHMISLRQGFEGCAVPSKFFGSLAAGRPLLYCGTLESCVAEWIKNENIGFIIQKDTIGQIADKMEELLHDENKIQQMQQKAFSVYHTNFSKKLQLTEWDRVLQKCIKV
jgi:glycosyltransferase involved in cell wall biosynthesis